VTINTYAVKTVVLALAATGSFVAAIFVGMGSGLKKSDYRPDDRQAISCDTAASGQLAAASPSRPNATC
jgi:hypothetical protein